MSQANTKAGQRGCQTESLLLIHGVLRNALKHAPELVSRADPGDGARVKFVADHLKEAFTALHNHHVHEDILWWDRLTERAPEHSADVERMKAAYQAIAREIDQLMEHISLWQRQPAQKEALLAALRQIAVDVNTHLDDEEKHIMPLCGRVLSQAEWDEAHTIGRDEIPKERLLFQLGYMLKCAPNERLRQMFWKEMPLPVRLLYNLMGKKKFEKERASLYGSLN